jgi:hypothetical protein
MERGLAVSRPIAQEKAIPRQKMPAKDARRAKSAVAFPIISRRINGRWLARALRKDYWF